jgi:hypothetical protein
VVEHDLAKVGVAGSNPVSRSNIHPVRPSGRRSQVVRRGSAKPVFVSSILTAASIYSRRAIRFASVPAGLRRWLAREPTDDQFPVLRRRGIRRQIWPRRIDEFRQAVALRGIGTAKATIAKQLGVPRSTVRYWLERSAGVAQSAEAIGLKPIQCGFDSHHQHQDPPYAYLLGMYLGDGCISRMPRTYRLRIFLHRNHTAAIERVTAAIRSLLPDHRVGCVGTRSACVVVTSYYNGWPELFPQHGAGRKHNRPIVLAPWQVEIVERHPSEFLRGLIESDGSRHRRIVRGKNYPAYSFTNHSADIRNLFMSTCERLGVRARQANAVTISIARRPDVARLDLLFGYTPDSPTELPAAVEGGDRVAQEEVGDAEDLVDDGLQGAAGAPPAGEVVGLVAGGPDDGGDLALEA